MLVVHSLNINFYTYGIMLFLFSTSTFSTCKWFVLFLHVPHLFCFFSSGGIRISVNPSFISSISINPTFTCTPEAADTGCVFTLWKFNETVINTNLPKYTTLPFKEHQKLLVSDHNVDDVGTYTCVYTCGAGNLRSPSIFLRYIRKLVYMLEKFCVKFSFWKSSPC